MTEKKLSRENITSDKNEFFNQNRRLCCTIKRMIIGKTKVSDNSLNDPSTLSLPTLVMTLTFVQIALTMFLVQVRVPNSDSSGDLQLAKMLDT